MIAATALFVASFVFVFLLSMQQMNVTARRYGLAFFTAVAICGAQIVQFKVLPADNGLLTLAAFMLGSALGVVTGMRVHPWLERVTAGDAVWPARVQQWLGREVEAFEHEETFAIAELGREIAREAARSDIEVHCQRTLRGTQIWYDIYDVKAEASNGAPDPVDLGMVNRAVRYLDGCEVLVRHALEPGLVRFQA